MCSEIYHAFPLQEGPLLRLSDALLFVRVLLSRSDWATHLMLAISIVLASSRKCLIPLVCVGLVASLPLLKIKGCHKLIIDDYSIGLHMLCLFRQFDFLKYIFIRIAAINDTNYGLSVNQFTVIAPDGPVQKY